MYCKNCGKELLKDSKFCSYCGTNNEEPIIDGSNNKKKIVLEIPEIEVKSNIKMGKKTKIFLILYLLAIVYFFLCMIDDGEIDNEEFIILLSIIIIPLFLWNIPKIWRWLSKDN